MLNYYSILVALENAIPPEVAEAAQNLADTTMESVPTTSEITEAANRITSLVPPIISNNYSLVIGALFIFLAMYILKAGIKLAMLIAIFAIGMSILTNLGIMPDLNSIFKSFMEFLEAMRSTPLPGM